MLYKPQLLYTLSLVFHTLYNDFFEFILTPFLHLMNPVLGGTVKLSSYMQQ